MLSLCKVQSRSRHFDNVQNVGNIYNLIKNPFISLYLAHGKTIQNEMSFIENIFMYLFNNSTSIQRGDKRWKNN